MSSQSELAIEPALNLKTRFGLAVWSVAAAFGAYFCMYAFRKPFTAATFSGGLIWGLEEKPVLVTAQVLGYTLSKVIGIRVVSEMPARRRASAILGLVALAEAALVFFAVAPAPWHVAGLFLNGLPLGMVFGMVLGFLEGRRLTEALTAGLCASFILADGVTKSVGSWLLNSGFTERWMPSVAGLLFVPLLLICVGMLSRIPPPDAADRASRSERKSMGRGERAALTRRYAPGLLSIVCAYLLITIARSIRADFAPELWLALGMKATPRTFASSELFVAFSVLGVNGLSILIRDNRRAFFGSLVVSAAGVLIMGFALSTRGDGGIGPFGFMVLMGVGLYLPYVAIHTTVFERMLAMTRERGNIGFLMYLADAAGYLGYAGVMAGKSCLPRRGGFLDFYTTFSWAIAGLALVSLVAGWIYFAGRGTAGEPDGVS